MTKNQIEYQKHLEDKRHNVISEGETQRHNVIVESQGWTNLQEIHRHNVEGEQIAWSQHHENVRHNKETEGIGWAQASAAQAQAAAALQNAATNRFRAEGEIAQGWQNVRIAQENMRIRRDDVQSQIARREVQNTMDTHQMAQGWVRTITNTLDTIIDDVGTAIIPWYKASSSSDGVQLSWF